MSRDANDLPDLDTVTALRLGEALFRFLARTNAESDLDSFTWEDAGINIDSGFIEVEREALEQASELIDQMSQKPSKPTATDGRYESGAGRG